MRQPVNCRIPRSIKKKLDALGKKERQELIDECLVHSVCHNGCPRCGQKWPKGDTKMERFSGRVLESVSKDLKKLGDPSSAFRAALCVAFSVCPVCYRDVKKLEEQAERFKRIVVNAID